ncbi:MAG: hypothetical protein OXB96_02240 [Candidatus Kaiserbacteria bacterium]|nr:hypothetical protein [Candidatus Kaiserbacteria bacterium]
MKKESTTGRNFLERNRQERQLDDLLRVTKDTNKMLRGERNARKIKMIVVLLVVLSLAGYGYYLFEKHKIKIIEFQQRVEELQQHLREAGALAGKVGDTADSIRGIFEGLESDTDTAKPETVE